MRTALIVGALTWLCLSATTGVVAAPILYTTTDLGTGYTLRTNADGSAYGLTNAAGAITYAFEKMPVIPIDERQDSTNNQSFRFPYFAVSTMRVGPYQNGFIYDSNRASLGGREGYAPITEGINSGWYLPGSSALYGTPYFKSPVLDMNALGQVVGVSVTPGLSGTYAAFTDVNGKPHVGPDDAAVADNLNNYLASTSGVSLTSAVKVDDLGRIIAVGADGHDYLLTPTSLGTAATVPEPSSLFALGTGVLILLAAGIPRKTRLK